MIASNEANHVFPDDATGDALRAMQAHGVDFSKDHQVEFALAFSNVEDAQRCARDIELLNQYTTVVSANDLTNGIDIIATRSMRLTHAGLTDAEAQLEELATLHNGISDGWGTLQD